MTVTSIMIPSRLYSDLLIDMSTELLLHVYDLNTCSHLSHRLIVADVL